MDARFQKLLSINSSMSRFIDSCLNARFQIAEEAAARAAAEEAQEAARVAAAEAEARETS